MIDLFIRPGDEIIIKFAVAQDKNGKIYTDAVKKDLEEVLGNKVENIEEYTVVFKKPSFKDTMEISQSISTDGTSIKLNLLADKYHKMIKLIKSWTLKDENGEILETNAENINALNPIIADIISSQLDSETNNMLV